MHFVILQWIVSLFDVSSVYNKYLIFNCRHHKSNWNLRNNLKTCNTREYMICVIDNMSYMQTLVSPGTHGQGSRSGQVNHRSSKRTPFKLCLLINALFLYLLFI